MEQNTILFSIFGLLFGVIVTTIILVIAFSFVGNDISDKELITLENKIREIDCVNDVVSINDITGTTIPLEMLPKKFVDHVSTDDSKLLLITFSTGTSDEETTDAVKEIEELSSSIKVGGMSAMSLDMRRLVESQTFTYVLLAVVCCLIILMISLDSYIVPLILLGNIGVSILFNMGTNIMFGEISYITKAIAAVLLLIFQYSYIINTKLLKRLKKQMMKL